MKTILHCCHFSITSSISGAALAACHLCSGGLLSSMDAVLRKDMEKLRKTLADNYVCSKPHRICEVLTWVAALGSGTAF